MTFRHLVGKSTFTNAIAIPKYLEEWFGAPKRGQKRVVTLLYGGNQKAEVELKRLKNVKSDVQLRYDSSAYKPFKEWLKRTFPHSFSAIESPGGFVGDFLEFRKKDTNSYRLNPIRGFRSDGRGLLVAKSLFANVKLEELTRQPGFVEVIDIISSVKFSPKGGPDYYREKFKKTFHERKWSADQKVIEPLALKCDFQKEGTFLKVEFGAASHYYEDYLTFQLAHKHDMLQCGALLVPTHDFYSYFLSLGRSKKEKGILTFEKVEKEFQYLKSIVTAPLFVLGLDFQLREDQLTLM